MTELKYRQIHQIWPSGVSLKRSCKMQFSRVDFRSIGSPSQKLWPNLIFPIEITKNAFPDINFYWTKDQESTLGNMIFQNLNFLKLSNVHLIKYTIHIQYLSLCSPPSGLADDSLHLSPTVGDPLVVANISRICRNFEIWRKKLKAFECCELRPRFWYLDSLNPQ